MSDPAPNESSKTMAPTLLAILGGLAIVAYGCSKIEQPSRKEDVIDTMIRNARNKASDAVHNARVVDGKNSIFMNALRL